MSKNQTKSQAQKKTRENIRIILLQYRDDPVIKQKEYDSFVKYTKLKPEQIKAHDATQQLIIDDMVDDFDGVIFAGAGDACLTGQGAYDNYPYLQPTKDLMRRCYDKNIPTLAVCLGAQIAAVEFGGKVEPIPEMSENGTWPMYLTEEAEKDPLYQGLHSPFNGQMGHNDTITQLPEGVVRLTYSDKVENQAFRFPDKKFYAVQYHPELDEEQLRFRFDYYKDYYADNKEEFQAILDSIKDSTDASMLLERFIDSVVLSEE